MAYKSDEERRAYFRQYNKGWYRRHKEKLIEMRRKRRMENVAWYKDYKGKLFCAECGENHPACLQFHHKDRKEKSFTISHIVGSSTYSLKTIIKEIDKCEVLCGNCHAKRHWREKHETDSWLETVSLEE
ncbi:MAG: hypothetical protein NVS4B11_04540 [Ktedonobacteraceae bacterium]